MSISAFNVKLEDRRTQGLIGGLIFIVLSVVVYVMDIHSGVISFMFGLLACAAVIALIAGSKDCFDKDMDFMARYTMPIFLMHTLFAAPLRAVLLKVGIDNAVLHVILGLAISFIGPIVATWIMKKTKWLEFFLYPNRFLGI